MKAALLVLWSLVKAPLARQLASQKFWTTVIGTAATFFGAWLAKHGFDLSDTHVEMVAGAIGTFFSLLLVGQASTDHGKAAAQIHADAMKDPPTPMPADVAAGAAPPAP